MSKVRWLPSASNSYEPEIRRFGDVGRSATASPAFGGNQAIAGSGEYRVRYESILNTGTAWHRQDDGVMHRTLPAKGEWRGQAISGSTRIVVADSD